MAINQPLLFLIPWPSELEIYKRRSDSNNSLCDNISMVFDDLITCSVAGPEELDHEVNEEKEIKVKESKIDNLGAS
jgi:hypothetical protein